MWKYFFLGLLVGWLIEWIIDWVYWRRGGYDDLPQNGGIARPIGSTSSAMAASVSASPASSLSPAPRPAASHPSAARDRAGQASAASESMAGTSSAEGTPDDAAVVEDAEVEPNLGATTSADTPAGRVGVDAAMGAGSAVSTSSATLSTNAPVYRQEDLEAIEGVGPKIGAMLRNNGITTFARLAATPASELHRVVVSTGEPTDNCRLETWAAQARLAANQEWAGLAQMQEELRSSDPDRP